MYNPIVSRHARLILLLWLACLLSSVHARAPDEASAWFTSGRPTPDALEAIRLLRESSQDGLDPADYQAESLTRRIEAARHGPRLDQDEEAALGTVLEQVLQSLMSDVHQGRVDPRKVHASFHAATEHFDTEAYLHEALARHGLRPAVDALRPRLPQYARLMQALARYRTLASAPALQQPLPALPRKSLARGDFYTGAAQLGSRLAALGDLPAPVGAGTRYDGALVDGVMAFQARHGLHADGVLGKKTLAELNVPIAFRIRQIALTMERLRWTPVLLSERMIAVNVPEFRLHAYETWPGGEHLEMNVVVGKAAAGRTPLFVEELRAIEFSPYWNIPASIARRETVPMLLRDPASFKREGLEFVDAAGQPVRELNRANLDAVLSGRMRIRQRPGPANALGDIKFIFPNNDNIYLHHTPARQLFTRERRDFSHGCIRVEEPVALAQFVLQDQPEWTEEKIRAAMAAGTPRTVLLKHPIPVLIAYGTAIAKADGTIHFFDDIYGNDALLEQALQAKKRATVSAGNPSAPQD